MCIELNRIKRDIDALTRQLEQLGRQAPEAREARLTGFVEQARQHSGLFATAVTLALAKLPPADRSG